MIARIENIDDVFQIAKTHTAVCDRGKYNEITRLRMTKGPIELSAGHNIDLKMIHGYFQDALKESAKVKLERYTEYWTSVDLYGFDPEQKLAVYQVRHFIRWDNRETRGDTSLNKKYYLVGYDLEKDEDEDDYSIREPVLIATINAAIRKSPNDPIAVVKAVQKKLVKLKAESAKQEAEVAAA